ncbi:MAG: helix-hairpin-helix domain-containing protein [Bacteroidia bacterium]|jgi:competence ComEA-like helix-hairpin-helix protein|nr:helix-hairpin-helix domain-containing protein [Bacteroidia bacterium]
MWPKFLRTYFGFTKQQGRGLFVLALLCLLVVVFRLIFPRFETEPVFVLKNLPLIKTDSSLSASENKPISAEYKKNTSGVFYFNPNLISYEQALQLGLKPSSAKALINFRKKGFVFRNKKDFTKVYGISDEDYNRLGPYILLDETVVKDKPLPNKTFEQPGKKENGQIIELNSVDSLALLQLKGIGPVFAKRILKYRTMLGGFFEVEQLKEVYGVDEALFEKVKPFVRIEKGLIRQININSDDFKVINKHPYISYELTKQLVNSRKNSKLNASAFKDLLNNDTLFQKLFPYCSFN